MSRGTCNAFFFHLFRVRGLRYIEIAIYNNIMDFIKMFKGVSRLG